MQLLEHFKELTLHPKNAQELKGLILQLAVQGKLTSQWREENPDVEPASFLLERIYEEKERLIKEKKIKKEKPLSNIEEPEIPYSLPNSWEWCKLGHSGYTQTGSTPPKNDSTNYGEYIPFIGPGDISNQWMKYPTEGLSEKGIAAGRLIPKGSLMMVCIGGSIGKCNINVIDVSCNQQINTITPLLIPSDFIKTVCQAPIFQNEVWKKSSGSATPIINKGKWENIVIPFPPLEEQKAIGEVVHQLFAEVEQLEALTKERIQLKADFATSALNQLTQSAEHDTASQWEFLLQHFGTFFTEKSTIKKLRQGILQLAVQGKLTHHWRATVRLSGVEVEFAATLLEKIKAEKEQFIKAGKIKKEKPLPEISDEEIPYELPEGWVWCRLEDLTSITGGVTKGKMNQKNLINSPYLRVANVQRGYLELDIMKEILVSRTDFDKYQLQMNDLLMIEGGDPDKVGRCAIWSNEIPGCIYQNHVFRVRPYLDSTMDNHFFMLFINSRVTRDYYENCAKRTTNLASINKTQMRNTPIAFPPLVEQKAILEKVNALMALCDKLEQEIESHQTTQEHWMQSCLREVVETKASDEFHLNIAAEPIARYGNK